MDSSTLGLDASSGSARALGESRQEVDSGREAGDRRHRDRGQRGRCGVAGKHGFRFFVDRDGALANYAGNGAQHGAGDAGVEGRALHSRAGERTVDRETCPGCRGPGGGLPVHLDAGVGQAGCRFNQVSAEWPSRFWPRFAVAPVAGPGRLRRLR